MAFLHLNMDGDTREVLKYAVPGLFISIATGLSAIKVKSMDIKHKNAQNEKNERKIKDMESRMSSPHRGTISYDGRNICSACWERDQKTVTVNTSPRDGITTPHGGRSHGAVCPIHGVVD